MRVCLFEDCGVSRLEPLTLTRPAFDLLCGLTSLADKQWAHFGPAEQGVLVRPQLAGLQRLQRPGTPINDFDWLRQEPAVLVNGRWLPPGETVADLSTPCVGLVKDQVAYAVLGVNQLTYCSPNTLDDCLETWKNTLPHRPAGGTVVRHPWELVEHNGEQITADFRRTTPPDSGTPCSVVGPASDLRIDPSARIDPLVVADTTAGPVVIDRGAAVTAFTHLEGPCYVGPHSHVLGAKVRAGASIGPHCRVGGEVEASILQGYVNKYHDGFLGHSVLGEWVNLGAGTQTSDLRNDYRPVTVPVHGREVLTGLTKVGCFLGDHTKTGLCTLLNTGTIAGAFCNLLPSGGYLPRLIPSFCSWWNGGLRENVDLARLIPTAVEVMRRRGVALTEVHLALYRRLCDQTAAQRQQALQQVRPLRLRRSA